MGTDDVGGDFDLDIEYVAVEEEDGTESLLLGGCGDIFFNGKMGEEGLDLFDSHVFGVSFVVEEDVAFDPFLVGLFGAEGVVFEADGV